MEDRIGSLPKGWVWTVIREISQNMHYGYTESSSENQIGPKFLRITDIQNNSVNWDSVPYCKINDSEKGKYLLKEGDLVFARTGATVGKSFLVRGKIPETVFASYLIRIILNKGIDKAYVYDFFQSNHYWSQIHKGKLGIGQPNVNAQILSRISIPIAPLPEQHRIVAKIEELFTRLDAGVEALKKIKVQLKRYRQAVLKYAFEGKLTQEWREANKGKIEPASVLLERIKEQRKKEAKGKLKELSPVDTSELSELPDGWVWTRFGEVLSPSNEKINPLEIEPLPYIGLEHIEKDTGKILGRGLSNSVRSTKNRFYTGDLLYGKLRPYLNKAHVPDFNGVCSTDIIVFSKNLNLSNKYVLYRILCDDFVRYSNQRVSGVQHPRVDFEKISEFQIPLSPLPEQHKIVEEIESRLSIADNIEKVAEQSLKQSDRLRQSILKQAFEGKLVFQDPTNELAEKLLERIKDEKLKQAKKEKIKRDRRRRHEQKTGGVV